MYQAILPNVLASAHDLVDIPGRLTSQLGVVWRDL